MDNTLEWIIGFFSELFILIKMSATVVFAGVVIIGIIVFGFILWNVATSAYKKFVRRNNAYQDIAFLGLVAVFFFDFIIVMSVCCITVRRADKFLEVLRSGIVQ